MLMYILKVYVVNQYDLFTMMLFISIHRFLLTVINLSHNQLHNYVKIIKLIS